MADQLSFLDAAEPIERKGEYPLPPGGQVEACRSCGAQIVWARTANDRAIPLSLATVQHRAGVAYCLPHFVDCKDAKEWSRK
jgi:hypothetical protein